VAVYFAEIVDQENQAYEMMANSELTVSRTAYSNNKSQYFVNGKASSFTEVTDLLKGKGIDLDHNRFLILQGEVESIAQMKPKAQNPHEDGLLEYLEDIIGTTQFKQPIEELSKKVDEFNDARAGVAARLHHCEKERNALSRKKDEAIEFLRAENEAARLKSLLYQVNQHEAAEACSKLQLELVRMVVFMPSIISKDPLSHRDLLYRLFLRSIG
jgi:structural maintenance of chromosome 4